MEKKSLESLTLTIRGIDYLASILSYLCHLCHLWMELLGFQKSSLCAGVVRGDSFMIFSRRAGSIASPSTNGNAPSR